MKVIKLLAITLAVIAVLATASWFLRNTLIQRISNPILKDYDVEVVDVSIDALNTRKATIGRLELVHAKGTTIVIEGLTLPVTTKEDTFKSYSARKVSIVTTTRDDEAPFEMARLIDQFLTLTDALPGTEIVVDEFKLAPYPTVRDLHWTLSASEQILSGSVGSVAISATTNRLDTLHYDVTFSLPGTPDSGSVPELVIGQLKQSDQGILVAGHSTLDLAGWEAITKLAGIVPEEVDIRSGAADFSFDTNIPYDVTRSPSVTAVLTPTSMLRIGYVAESGDSTDVLVTESGSIEIAATFPEVEWSLRQSRMSLMVTNGEWHDIPLSLSEVSCQSGPICSMQASTSWTDAIMPIGSAKQIDMSSSVGLSFPEEGVRVDVKPDAVLKLTGLSAAARQMERVEAHMVSAGTMQYAEDGWDFAADSIDANVESLLFADGFSVTAPVYLENLTASERDRAITVNTGVFVPSIQAVFNEQAFATPGVRGSASLQEEAIVFDLKTVEMFRNGTIKGQHHLERGIGEVAIIGTALTFNGAALSKRVAPWKYDWDVIDGNIAVDLQANWDPSVPGHEFRTASSIAIESLSGTYSDTVLAGLSTGIRFSYTGATGFEVAPATISVELIEVGLPIENLTADFVLDMNNLAVDVENLQMMAFNGVISAEPFSFRTGRDVNNMTLMAEKIELTELLAIKEFEAVQVTGTIGAVLPITIEADGISIEAGVLMGEQPGGVIRYLGGRDSKKSDTSAIGLATEALSNFEYESLTSNVTYSKDGNLKLQMQLKGRNPEMKDSRPVVLNLGVENNVIQMLRSLQAARAVEGILEKRLAE